MHIASGKYEHRDNGIANGITETWHSHSQSDGSTLLKIEFQSSYLMKADVVFKDSHVKQFNYRIDENLRGIYVLPDSDARQIHVSRWLAGGTKLEDIIPWSDNAVLDLPFLSCKGHTILHLKKYGTAPTFAPIFHSGDRAGDLAKKSVRVIGEETIKIGEKSYSATHYHYMRDYWLDEHGRVLKVQDKDNNYEMILVEYTS